MITVLSGGVGGSRFIRALASVIAPDRITAIVNTADDEEFHGLYVSPDPDIVTYALAGVVDEDRGWGFRGDTFRWLESIRRFGHETWFQIGDRDLATHLHRTRMLRDGATLTEVTAGIARAFGVEVRILPMSDDRVRTVVETPDGDLPFQQFLVKRHAQDDVIGVRFEGAEHARPGPAVIDALRDAEAIFIAPSDPVASIMPILKVPGIREAIDRLRFPCIAVSPVVGDRSLQPPAGQLLAGLGFDVTAAGIARFYGALIDTLLIDVSDAAYAAEIEAQGIRPVVTATVMRNEATSRALALAALYAAGVEP